MRASSVVIRYATSISFGIGAPSLHLAAALILDPLAQLQRELGVAYLFITHNFGVVEHLAHDLAVMPMIDLVGAQRPLKLGGTGVFEPAAYGNASPGQSHPLV